MTTSIGELMTENLQTIGASNSAQEAAKKMTDKKIGSLIVVNDDNRPIGIVTERDLVRKVCVHDASSKHTIIHNIMSDTLVTIDAMSQVEVAADIMIQNQVRHLLVVRNNDTNKPLGIITPSDFAAYLKENLNIDDVNAKIIESLKEAKETGAANVEVG
jgi:CBS domain-containing protein